VKKRVVVGMSGGVDSSVAALLLLRDAGHEVVGATMSIYSGRPAEGPVIRSFSTAAGAGPGSELYRYG